MDVPASIGPGGDLALLVLLGAERVALVVDFAGHYVRHCHVPEHGDQEVMLPYVVG